MVPRGWIVSKLGEGIKLISGQHVEAIYCTENPEDTPYLTGPADFSDGAIKAAKYVATPKVLCQKGDILITVKGSGTGSVIRADRCYCISRQLMAIRPTGWCADFVFYHVILNSAKYNAAAVGLIPGITRADLLETKILIPPLSEQRKIAATLSSWDRAIKQTQKLIDAKSLLKKGLMQQLLTGKRRFGKFKRQEWQVYRLGDLFTERKEINRLDLNLLSITADRGVIPREEVDRKDSSTEDKSKYKRIAPGDIGYNTMRMWQGVSGVSELEGIVSPAYTIVVPKKNMLSRYVTHLFKHGPTIHLFHRYSQGLVNDTLNLKFPAFSRIRVSIPHVNEQKKIAACLDACDWGVAILQKRLVMLSQQKKGLMQQLLTGRIRVKLNDDDKSAVETSKRGGA